MKVHCNKERVIARGMEQSTSACDDFLCFNEDENEVAAILLELPELIAKSNSDFRSANSVSWALKKRRSAIQDNSSRFLKSPSLPSPSLRPPQPRRAFVADVKNSVPLEVQPEEPNVKVVQATSPATPLSFSPSECDEKPECSKRRRAYNKKLQEKLMMEETINQINKSNEVLQREIENVKRHHLNLQTENMLLKAKKNEVLGLETVEPSLNLTLEFPQTTVKSPAVDTTPVMLRSQPLIADLTTQAQAQTLFNGVPDLNESVPDPEAPMPGAASAQPFFLGLASINKAMAAAQARQRRIEICRAKLRPAAK